MHQLIDMNHGSTYAKVMETVAFLKARSPLKPKIGLVLGSGLSTLGDETQNKTELLYSEIPNFHPTSVEGHPGRVVLGNLFGVPTAILQGRFHYYEGHSIDEVVLPTRVLGMLGVHTLILTNAAGAINTRFRPGDIMLITDHLNLTGSNPLKGPNIPELGPRFPDMSEPYDKDCVEALKHAAETERMAVHTGVYAGLLGPSYETPAEIRMYRTLGADAVGMSTVFEAIAANHMGLRVAGLSSISNFGAGMSSQKLTHSEVMESSGESVKKLSKILKAALPPMAKLGAKVTP